MTLITTADAARLLGTSEAAIIQLGTRGRLTRYGARNRQRWSLDQVRELARAWRLTH